MFWFIVAISAYFFLAISSLGDKIFLKGKEDPKTYVFYVCLLSGLIVFLIPFITFNIQPFNILIWPILEGITYAGALYALYYALDRFEVSVVVPVLGGLQPVFIFLLSFLFFNITEVSFQNIIALIVLIIGTVLISLNGKMKFKSKGLLFCFLPAFLFALDFILTKQVFLNQSFLEGLVYMRVSSCLIVLFFLFNGKFRRNIFKEGKKSKKKTIFLGAQGAGAIGALLQSYAISLVPAASLAILNALKGTQYVFLLILTFIISIFYSKILKEDFHRKNLIIKVISIIIIGLGIALLTL
ncbi:MAG: EamA family transporter [Candidatus Pacebacteria bacterium]|nr:EamA family transporter [Candidatus Paceibacterota bacterium]